MKSFNKSSSSDSPTGRTKTVVGKRRVRLNALKHGFFSRELIVGETDKSEFEALREAIRTQLTPTTTMRNLGCDRVVAATWRFKLALRMEMERLRTSSPENQQDRTAKSPLEEAPSWYLSGPSELRTAQKMLNGLREDIAHSGDLHLAERKVWIQKTFGDNFYDTLAEWTPVRPDSILMAEQLAGHAEDFNKPLPGVDQSKQREASLAYGRARWEMMVKVVELKSQEIAALSSVLGQLEPETVSQLRFLAIDGVSRHITSAARELERSIDWYQYLLEKRL